MTGGLEGLGMHENRVGRHTTSVEEKRVKADRYVLADSLDHIDGAVLELITAIS